MTLKVEKLARETYDQLKTKREIARLEKEKETLFERVVELANGVSERNIHMYRVAQDLETAIADLLAS